MFRSNSQLISLFQRILDVVALLLITWLMYKWLGQEPLMRVLAIYGSLLLIILFSLFNVYRSWRGISLFQQLKTLFFSWVSVLVIFNVLLMLLSNKEQLAVLWPFCLFKVPIFLLWSLFVFICLAILRISVKLILLYFRKKGYNQRSAVIVGAAEGGKELAKYLYENPGMGINVKGFFDDRLEKGKKIMASSKELGEVLGSIDECPQLSLDENIEMVFITLPMRAEKEINQLIWALGTKGVSVFMIPDLFAMGILRAKIHNIGELNLIGFNLFPAWKRIFDIFFSIMVLVITSPIWSVIIILIKNEDRGPVLYKDPRIGENGKRFEAWKFRTMHINAAERLNELLEQDPGLREEYEKTYKLKNDPRITKIGKILRRTSLDEFPQFINVIKGEMSVVGARPVLPPQFETHYQNIALTYCATRPGVTGPWQIGPRSDAEDYRERLELDKWYVLNASIWLDIKIILKTIWRIFQPKGAY